MANMIRNKLLFASFLAALSLQVIACTQSAALPPWKQDAFKNIIAVSSPVRADLPVKVENIAKTIDFLDAREVGTAKIENVIVVLGNMPLDESTPTIDLIYRAVKGAEIAQGSPNALIIMTGGKTAGRISEAEMMGVIAISRGISPRQILLEESSR